MQVLTRSATYNLHQKAETEEIQQKKNRFQYSQMSSFIKAIDGELQKI
jgi:hypothetical protein